jgi:hypothetical protein
VFFGRPVSSAPRRMAVVESWTPRLAGVAQLVEQLIRNQQVIGSSPIAGSKIPEEFRENRDAYTRDGSL